MKTYQIPDTDNGLQIAKNLKFNYRKYRSMLHFIYLNKDSFVVDDEKVKASAEIMKDCGRIVFKSRNLKFNYKDWKRMWEVVSKDEVFIQHVKELMDITDIMEYLNGTLPCGITRGMQDIMSFGESLRKCYDQLNQEVNSEDVLEIVQEDYKKLENWLKKIENIDPTSLMIPNLIYKLAQKYAAEEAPNFTDVINSLITTNRHGRLFQPYVWATLLEQFHNVEVELPPYKPIKALVISQDDNNLLELYESIDEEAENDQNKLDIIEKQKLLCDSIDSVESIESNFGIERRARLKRKCTEKPPVIIPQGAIINKKCKNQDINRNQIHKQKSAEERQYLAKEEPQATISIPILTGMIVEGLEFKVRIKSFRVEDHSFRYPRRINWTPNYRYNVPEEESNFHYNHENSNRVYQETTRGIVHPLPNSKLQCSTKLNTISEVDSKGGKSFDINDEIPGMQLCSKTDLHDQVRSESKLKNNEIPYDN